MRCLYSVVAVAALAANSAVAQGQAITWGPAPAIFPAGAKMAVLQGDPSKPEMFTVRLDFPNGYRVAPHFHPTDEHVTVIKGTLLLGMGDKLDRSNTSALLTGGFATAAANMHHYAIAKGRTIVQVSAIGPFALTYVNPADDPSPKAKAQ